MNGIVDVLLGGILSILVTIWVEYLRKPKIEFHETNEHDGDYSQLSEKRPASKARFLSITIENKRLAWIVRWLSRNAALQCHAEITFYHLDGQDIFGRVMTGRWSGSTEPIPNIQILGDKTQIFISNNSSTISTIRKDIYPGEPYSLDVAARFDNDEVCFGWNDEAYFSNPLWRNPKWKLLPGRYFVRVELISAGDKVKNYYRLINDTDITSFRLEKIQLQDIKRIKV